MNITYDIFLDDPDNVYKAQKNLNADTLMINVKDYFESKMTHLKDEIESEDKINVNSNTVICIEGLDNNMGYYCIGYSKELSDKIMSIFDDMERRHLATILLDTRTAWRSI